MTTTNTNLNLNDMDWCDNIFDVPDYLDHDGNNDELENILEEYYIEFDFDFIRTNVDEEYMITDENMITTNDHVDNQKSEKCILSQKLSQLSTSADSDHEDVLMDHKKRPISTPSTSDVSAKKLRILDVIENENNFIPSYLQATNILFDTIMTDYVTKRTSSTYSSITVKELRELAILKHTIGAMRISRELWTAYLKSGTGELETKESSKTTVDRRVWPIEVKESAPLKVNSNGKNEQQQYEDVAIEHLEELTRLIEQYQNEYEGKKNGSVGFTEEMEKTIERLVQQYGIRAQETKLAYKIAILSYDYDAQILEREYQRQQPTEHQIRIARHLYELRYNYVQSKQELIELKQRVLCNKPSTSLLNYISGSTSMANRTYSMMTTTTTNTRHYQFHIDLQEKKLQHNMTDSMALSISEGEQKMHQCQTLLNDKIRSISVKTDQDPDGLPENLIDLIYRYFQNINKKLEYISKFRINYDLKSHYGNEEVSVERIRHSFSPTMIIDTSSHQLTDEQLKLLNRGPTYVPPCQIYTSSSLSSSSSSSSSSKCVSIEHLIQQQYKLLQHHLSVIFSKYKINPAQSMFVNKQIKDLYIRTFSLSPPLLIYKRAVHELELVRSIREHLKKNQVILRRTADLRNVFYMGNRQEFEEKANEYMTKTDIFEFRELIDPMIIGHAQEYLTKIIRSMNSGLEKIFNNQKYHRDILKKLYIDVDKVQWSYLYFLPDVSKKDEVSLKPCIVSQNSITSRLAQFLVDLLRPVVLRHIESTSFENGADFIRKFNRYIDNNKQHFHSKTIFATIYISNYYTMASHATMLTTLSDFLNDHLAIPYVEHLSIDKIIDLTSLFLKNNHFYYDNNIYRCTRGCPESFEFSDTLADVYTLQWQQLLLRELAIDTEFYGRCQKQIFFTWNRTSDELWGFFQTFGSRHKNIQLDVRIGTTLHFSNIYLENVKGTLYSRVYHDLNSQAYTLPYVLDNTIDKHSHWLRSALIRAVHYCTSVYDFHQERIYLEITCLTNGYSLEFVERRIQHFLTHFDALSLRFTLDQQVYDRLRHRLSNFISEQQQFCRKKQELEQNKQIVRLSYLYAYGPQCEFNQKLKEILSENLSKPVTQPYSNRKLKIKVMTKHQYSLNALLSEQKPIHPLLNETNTIF